MKKLIYFLLLFSLLIISCENLTSLVDGTNSGEVGNAKPVSGDIEFTSYLPDGTEESLPVTATSFMLSEPEENEFKIVYYMTLNGPECPDNAKKIKISADLSDGAPQHMFVHYYVYDEGYTCEGSTPIPTRIFAGTIPFDRDCTGLELPGNPMNCIYRNEGKIKIGLWIAYENPANGYYLIYDPGGDEQLIKLMQLHWEFNLE